MARSEQVKRQWKLLKFLSASKSGYTLEELAKRYRTSPRNIQRDLGVLKDMDLPVEFAVEDSGKRRWHVESDLLKLAIGLDEMVALTLAHRLFEPLAGTHYTQAMDMVLTKIRDVVPEEALEYAASLDRILLVIRKGVANYKSHQATIRLLENGIRTGHSLEITYQKPEDLEPFTTLFDPYGLVYSEGDMYVVGYSAVAKDIRTLKVSRIKKAKPTEEEFNVPDDFDLEDRFRTSFGVFHGDGRTFEVVVRFTGWAAKVVEEKQWHVTQHTEWLDPGRTLFDMKPAKPGVLLAKFGLSTTLQFKSWVKQFGDKAEVLEPDWLRAELREELLEAAKMYE